MHSTTALLILAAAVAAAVAAAGPVPASAQSAERCFGETGQCISGPIRSFWERSGGLPVFGMPTGPLQEITADGKAVQAQWFERARMELHPDNQPPYRVLLGRLGAEVSGGGAARDPGLGDEWGWCRSARPAREALAARRAGVFDVLETAVGAHRSASTLGEVWRCAQEGRGATLVVEEGYHEPAVTDERGWLRKLAFAELGRQPLDAGARGAALQAVVAEVGGERALDDAVDEVIATVIARGGRVVFVDDGTLAQHGRIALTLRY